MGCGASGEEKDPRVIEYEMKETRVEKFDTFFKKFSEILEKCENIRHGLQDTREELVDETQVDYLKDKSANHFWESVKVFFWSVSSVNKGDIKKAKLDFGSEFPYITFENNNLYVEQVKMKDNLTEFLKTCKEAPPVIPELTKQVDELAKEGDELVKNGMDEAKNAGLNPFDAAKAVANAGNNMKIVAKNLPKVKELPNLAKIGADDLNVLLSQFGDAQKEFDTYGAKADAQSIWRPYEIFHKLHPGQKMTHAEYEKYEKEEKSKTGHKKKDPKKVSKKDEKKA